MSILEDVDNIECSYIERDEKSFDKALALAKEDDNCKGVLSFSSKDNVYRAAHSQYAQANLIYGLLFEGPDDKKTSFVIDASGYLPKTVDTAKLGLNIAKQFSEKMFHKAERDFAFSYLAIPDIADEEDKAIDDYFRASEKGYHGYIEPDSFINGASPIVIAAGPLARGALESAVASHRKDYEKQVYAKSKGGIFSKWGSNSAVISARPYDESGFFLFGADKAIVVITPDSHYSTTIGALDNLFRLDRAAIR